MPNWCYTKLTIKGDPKTIQDLKGIYFTEDALDFQKVVPMPEELNIECGSTGHCGREVLVGDWKETLSGWLMKEIAKEVGYEWEPGQPFPIQSREQLVHALSTYEKGRECLGMGLKYINNMGKYGYENWWGWRIDNWGTKWSLDPQCFKSEKMLEADPFTQQTYRFETAWSPCLPIMVELSKVYPLLEFEMIYLDEGGFFAGQAICQDGFLSDEDLDWRHVAETEFGWEFEDPDEVDAETGEPESETGEPE